MANGLWAGSKRVRTDPALQPSIQEIKLIDLEIAKAIAGFAGIPVRDKKGGMHANVWCLYKDDTIGSLIVPGDMRDLLIGQLKQQMEAKKDQLLELEEHDVVCKWIIEYTRAWEEVYHKSRGDQHDISQQLISTMHEVYFEVADMMDEGILDTAFMRSRVDDAAPHHTHRTLTGNDAIVRFLFRNPYTRHYMCRIAGKILQKREVCNKAGAYSARIQRNDITQEKDEAMTSFYDAVLGNDPLLAKCKELMSSEDITFWIVEHTTQIQNNQ